jgi:DNA-binding response OmpR family regulator
MSTPLVRILIVGPPKAGTDGIIRKLTAAGLGSHSVASVAEAETVLKTIRFKVVLSAEKLPDGTGYELASLIGRQAGTLFIGVSLSETCLWLPVVEKGSRTLGRRAMNPTMLEAEMRQLLRPVRESNTEWNYDTESDAEQRPLAFATGPLRADLVAGVIQDESILRERGRVPMPPRRRLAEPAAGGKHLMSSPSRDAKPLTTGMAGKHWRG